MIPVNATDATLSADVQLSPNRSSSKSSIRTLWWLWLFSLSAVAVVLFITLPIAPFLHMDEFIIVELGRVILNPNTDWSTAWLVDQQQPVILLSYIGPLGQELIYKIGGQFAPRVSAIIGALVAASLLVCWLLSRNTNPKAAFLLGVIFLLDPLFLQAFTIGRLDGWAMAFCFGSCWALRDAIKYTVESKSYNILLFLGGALACFAFFIWPSAALLYPLILMELLFLVRNVKANYKEVAKIFLSFIVGGVATTLLLILPVAEQFFAHFDNILSSFLTNTHAPKYGGDNLFVTIRSFVSFLKFTPVLFLISVFGIINSKKFDIALALFAAVVMMIVTIVYIHRVAYLVPYMIICVSLLFIDNKVRGVSYKLLIFVGPLLTWSVFLSLVLRTYMAFNANAESDRDLVKQTAVSMIREGEPKVLMTISSAELYYPGRLLGWRMYAPYLAIGQPLEPSILKKLLKQVDYVILRNTDAAQASHLLIAEGFYLHKIYPLYDYTAEKFTGITTNIWRLRFLYSIYEQSYGPYALYVRRNQSTSCSVVSISRGAEVE